MGHPGLGAGVAQTLSHFPCWEERQRTRTGRGPHDKESKKWTRTGRGPHAGVAVSPCGGVETLALSGPPMGVRSTPGIDPGSTRGRPGVKRKSCQNDPGSTREVSPARWEARLSA
eukprot:gene11266-biopygen16853